MILSADGVSNCTASDQGAGAGVTPSSALQFWVSSKSVSAFLAKHHYLGPVARGFAWSDEWGVVVLAKPTARRLPQDGSWLELVRWCLVGARNGGSRQWKRIARNLRRESRLITTVVSYSDPSQGHTGALYKAAGWKWAPTWHRLRPPPSGNGSWKNGEPQAVKDRWVYELRADDRREEIIRVKDDAIVKRLGPKQRVLRRWPKSHAEKFGNGWFIYTPSKPHRIEVEIGTGLTANEAWADADNRTSGDKQK